MSPLGLHIMKHKTLLLDIVDGSIVYVLLWWYGLHWTPIELCLKCHHMAVGLNVHRTCFKVSSYGRRTAWTSIELVLRCHHMAEELNAHPTCFNVSSYSGFFFGSWYNYPFRPPPKKNNTIIKLKTMQTYEHFQKPIRCEPFRFLAYRSIPKILRRVSHHS